MSRVKVRLTGCERYNFKGELYLRGKTYLVNEVKAKIMLRKQDEYDRNYFTVYIAPEKSKSQRIAEIAADALAKATAQIEAEESDVVEYLDDPVDEEVKVDPDAAVEVDTDDDPDLDEDDEDNSEVVEDDEDEKVDRDDGSAFVV